MSDSSKYSAPSLIGRPIQDFVELNRVWEELEKEKYILQLGPHEELPQEELEKGFLACIQEGSLACKMNNGGSQHVLLAIMVTNDLVGLESLFGHKPRQIEYYSREATRLNLFSMSRVRKMMSMSAQLVEFFLEVQSFQLRELASHLQVVSNRSLIARVAAGILYFNGKLGARPWTNKELAAWAGVTQEGVGRSFSCFLAEGLVRKTGRRTQIEKRRELEELASTFKSGLAPHLISGLISKK